MDLKPPLSIKNENLGFMRAESIYKLKIPSLQKLPFSEATPSDTRPDRPPGPPGGRPTRARAPMRERMQLLDLQARVTGRFG